jgi:hypothetical protein
MCSRIVLICWHARYRSSSVTEIIIWPLSDHEIQSENIRRDFAIRRRVLWQIVSTPLDNLMGVRPIPDRSAVSPHLQRAVVFQSFNSISDSFIALFGSKTQMAVGNSPIQKCGLQSYHEDFHVIMSCKTLYVGAILYHHMLISKIKYLTYYFQTRIPSLFPPK